MPKLVISTNKNVNIGFSQLFFVVSVVSIKVFPFNLDKKKIMVKSPKMA